MVDNEYLDYEVEEGECSDAKNKKSESDCKKVEEVSGALEEGEILDDEDTFTPETFESRNICKFFLRGRCTWGVECRFLHCVQTDDEDFKLEPVKSVISHVVFDVVDPTQVRNAWEHGLRVAKSALHNSCKYKMKFQEESDHESKMPSAEIRFTRHPQTRNYSPVRKESTYEPEYSKIRRRETRHSKHEDQEYKSKRPKREVSIPREKEAWTRSKSAADPKRKRNYSSSNSSTSDSSSDSSLTSRSSGRSRKKHDRRNREHLREIKEQNHSDKFRRSRKQITTNREKVRRNGRTKRSVTSSSSSSSTDYRNREHLREIKEQNHSDKFRCSRKQITTNCEKVRRTKRSVTSSSSSSSTDSDRSVSKTRNRNKRRLDSNLKNNQVTKNRQRSSSLSTVPKCINSAKKISKRAVLLEKLKNIEEAIAKYDKHK